MKFRAYTHIEKVGKPQVYGINHGLCYIYPKLDGTNACVWYDLDTDSICAGSRKRQITVENDNGGFAAYATEHADMAHVRDYCKANPDKIVYGEWLGGVDGRKFLGTVKDYTIGGFFVFDVYDETLGRYLRYEEYAFAPHMNEYTRVVPTIAKIEDPTEAELAACLDGTDYILPKGVRGEGIVIKNYDFLDEYGHYQMAKVITSEFHERKKHSHKRDDACVDNEAAFVDEFCTNAFIEKCKLKTLEHFQADEWNNDKKYIGYCITLVVDDLMREEFYDYFRRKMPKVDLGRIRALAREKFISNIGL